MVVPNARCPVCGALVYFHSNEHGSRVYFDELGHPWPKHPCTDTAEHRDPFPGSGANQRPRMVDTLHLDLWRRSGATFVIGVEDGTPRKVIHTRRPGSDDVVSFETIHASGSLPSTGAIVFLQPGTLSFLNEQSLQLAVAPVRPYVKHIPADDEADAAGAVPDVTTPPPPTTPVRFTPDDWPTRFRRVMGSLVRRRR